MRFQPNKVIPSKTPGVSVGAKMVHLVFDGTPPGRLSDLHKISRGCVEDCRAEKNRWLAHGHSLAFLVCREFGERALRCAAQWLQPARTLVLATLACFTLRQFEIGRQLLLAVERAGGPKALGPRPTTPEAFGQRQPENSDASGNL
jgi:hypothetical protein